MRIGQWVPERTLEFLGFYPSFFEKESFECVYLGHVTLVYSCAVYHRHHCRSHWVDCSAWQKQVVEA